MHIINLYIFFTSSFEYKFYNFHCMLQLLNCSLTSTLHWVTLFFQDWYQNTVLFQSSEFLHHSANVKLHKSFNHSIARLSSAINICVIIPVRSVVSHLILSAFSISSFEEKRSCDQWPLLKDTCDLWTESCSYGMVAVWNRAIAAVFWLVRQISHLPWAKFGFWVWGTKIEARRAEAREPKGRSARPLRGWGSPLPTS